MVRPDREGTANNVAGVGTGDQTWELDARNIMFRIDHSFTPNFRANHSFYWNRRPSVRNCEGPDGCNYDAHPDRIGPNTDYYAAGSSSGSRPTTPISSSTGSSRTTC